ncbi:YhcH/YjgK/YiaL family protein [Paenibacillus arenilitoris]|uniref:YhcH/YjgK/YiaL family protein n=1 Tax=Paenibacillus arenilitoris TaxID=2772299 RepID=A0A927CMP5_9BACL|nr:YhcH/YjgK/YiaL family protein [Paenibacillus arenilitoris]MBD2868986.1 YhcH/YjgK/YiaL family protein [Paenibacillus arenilitoris]
MIVDTIRNWERNKSQYGEAVQQALAFIQTLNTDEMPSTVEIVGSQMYVMKQTPTTERFDKRPSEVHALHADIHIVLEGEEWQAFAPASNRNQPVLDRLEDSDYALFDHVEDETVIKLGPGAFTVYWPGEYHRPNCSPEGGTALVKLVVKIHSDRIGDIRKKEEDHA